MLYSRESIVVNDEKGIWEEYHHNKLCEEFNAVLHCIEKVSVFTIRETRIHRTFVYVPYSDITKNEKIDGSWLWTL